MMKKVTYLLTMIFAVALMSTSCCKDDPVIPEEDTLETLYPDWVDLTWVSTDGYDANFPQVDKTYPRLEITIVGDVVNVHQLTNGTGGFYDGNFTEVTINGSVITFSDDTVTDSYDDQNVTGMFSVNETTSGKQITFTTFGLMDDGNPDNEHEYVLD